MYVAYHITVYKLTCNFLYELKHQFYVESKPLSFHLFLELLPL